jgi:hypothetical protein
MRYVLLALLGLVVALEVVFVIPGTKDSRFLRYAQQILASCQSAGYKPTCYDREIPKLLDKLTMEEAFAVTRHIQEEDPSYLSCHVLGHYLSYNEVEKNPDAWKDVMTRCPANMCNNGCLHGALMRRYNDKTFVPAQYPEVVSELSDVCEPRGSWRPTEVERSMCYHALGHLVMYATEANLPASVDMCQQIGTKDDGRNYVQTCTEGAFMTVFQPLEPEDFALIAKIAPTKETVGVFCQAYSGLPYDACRRESWPLFANEMDEPAGLLSFCSYRDDADSLRTCMSAMMNHLTESLVVRQGGRTDVLTAYCQAMPQLQQSWCFGAAAMRLIQLDPAYQDLAREVCTIADKGGVGEYCYRGLVYYGGHSFQPNSTEKKQYCERLPQAHQGACLTSRGIDL